MTSPAPDPSPRPAATPNPADAQAWAPTQIIPRAAASRPAAIGNALPVGTRMAEFEVLKVIGEGGFGIVYLVQDHMLQRRVAIKEYMPATLAARGDGLEVVVKAERDRALFNAGLDGFLQEARMLAQFDHPALLKVYRFWQANGTAYMVMPFYEGTTLKATLKALGAPPDERWLMALLAPLTEALGVLHAERCYHRDIAPDNILLLAGSGKPLLLDFGAARMVISDATQALTAILKPGYAPVEQYAEVPGMKQGPWTDVYALCAVVYAAITGTKPPAAVGRTVQDSYVPLVRAAAGRYSAGFLQAIDDGLRVRPDERTESVQALRQAIAIDGGGAGGVTVIVPSSRPPAAPPPVTVMPPVAHKAMPSIDTGPHAAAGAEAKGSPKLLWAGVGSLVLLAGAGALWLQQRSPAPAAMPAAPLANPAPAAPAPAATVAPAGPASTWSPVSEFDRILQGRSAGFDVQAGAQQPSLRIGKDRLVFTVRSARDGYLYVYSASGDGTWLLLYPNSQATQNRVRAGQALTLPQANWPLDTTEPAGEEYFLALVSENPRDFSALGLVRETWFQKLPTGSAAATLAQGHTASGSVFAGRAQCATAGCDAYGAVRFSVTVTR
ncbi:serine/threonine-protein kinase [Aquabacterium sp. OR-4]|uniref:serine/threonine-protein kinase n=1 Tax=Aquabacterium sp. OR-4 TaxID=2978127 RepID=UPI0021B2A07C|nr:serine/threonine-protein kinase [Aquabacterium sp. OR-4]MDT7834762.1 serine/threonine-protein kinase [Aquabacterium sp. OR-4]